MATKFEQSSNITAQNQLVQWINNAGMSEGQKRSDLLRKIIEVLVHQCAGMIPVYMENILSYVNDKNSEVKKQVISFIEELSKNHRIHLPKVVGQLRLLIVDQVIAVQKRAIQAASIVYRNALLWICAEETTSVGDLQYVWQNISEIKLYVLNLIDSENEGIRTHSIKFLEEVVLMQTPGSGPDEEFSLDRLPQDLTFIRQNNLEEESQHIFTLLLKFHNSQHISSVNLMACMTSLCLLAKLRPKYMPRVIQALGDLHTTLPPTLSQSQVNSVRKHLKMLLVNLIKHPSSNDSLPPLTQLLLDIGMTQQEIHKVIPKERRLKRIGELKNGDVPQKRSRIDSPQSNSQGSDSSSRTDFNFDEDSGGQVFFNTQAEAPVTITPVPPIAPVPPVAPVSFVPPVPSVPLPHIVVTSEDVTEESIVDGLDSVDNVVNLVMATLSSNLPNDMPNDFVAKYTPIPNAGSKAQKITLAKMILSIIKNEDDDDDDYYDEPLDEPKQPSLSDLASKIPLLKDDDEKITLKNAVAKLQVSTKADRTGIESAVTKLREETRQEHIKEEERKVIAKEKEKEKLIPPQTPTVPKLKQKVKMLKLQEITRPIPKEIKERLTIQAVERILRAEKEAAIGGASVIRAKFISIFASSYTPELRELVLNYILEDPGNRIDLALSWLYEEYAFMQGFNRHPVTLQPKVHEKHDQNYNQLLCALITQIFERGDPNIESCKDVLLRKIFSEAPLITDEAVDYLKHLVTEDKVALLALEILEELCIMRPPRAHKYVTSLLCHTLSETEEIRNMALESSFKIYKKGTDAVRKAIEKHALLYLGFISLSSPPHEVSARHSRLPWTDDQFKICLNLVVGLLADNEDLLVDVARVYGEAGHEARRCVLRALEGRLRAMVGRWPPLPPALEALLDESPRGAETMITRIVHMLTEKAPATPELVCKVRELYATRVSDVRLLIPVLNGLTKKEVLAALPKLIKLNPAIVKEVFNKLLGLQNVDDQSPVEPAELLVALHLIDPSTADLKYIIRATAICFAEKQVYTQDVVAEVLQTLSSQKEIPVLMMRSVLQALTLYPALTGLVTNMLQLLVEQEVWQHKVAWEGWVKCCERLLPAACYLLVSLPARALTAALAASPALGAALARHVATLTPQEHALLPQHVQQVCAQPQPPRQETPYAPLDRPFTSHEVPFAPQEVPFAPQEVPFAPHEVPFAPHEVPFAPHEVPFAPHDPMMDTRPSEPLPPGME